MANQSNIKQKQATQGTSAVVSTSVKDDQLSTYDLINLGIQSLKDAHDRGNERVIMGEDVSGKVVIIIMPDGGKS